MILVFRQKRRILQENDLACGLQKRKARVNVQRCLCGFVPETYRQWESVCMWWECFAQICCKYAFPLTRKLKEKETKRANRSEKQSKHKGEILIKQCPARLLALGFRQRQKGEKVTVWGLETMVQRFTVHHRTQQFPSLLIFAQKQYPILWSNELNWKVDTFFNKDHCWTSVRNVRRKRQVCRTRRVIHSRSIAISLGQALTQL